MKKTIVIILLLLSSLFAENFSNMSTQELIAIMGYVKPENKKAFLQELQSRISTMNTQEKKQYKKNLKRLKQQ